MGSSAISDEMLTKLLSAAGELGIDLGVQGEEGGKPEPQFASQVSVTQELKDLGVELGRLCAVNGLYRFGSGSHYVTVHENEASENDLMHDMTEDRFVSWVQNFTELTKWNEKAGEEKRIAAMTGVMARQVMAVDQFVESIPKIKAVLTVRMPVFRDGVPVLLDVGYNPEEEIYVVRDVPEVVDHGLEWAKKEYDDLFGQFPLDSERSKAAHVACCVGLYSRYLFADACAVPLFQFTANMEGAGKSVMAKCAIVPVFGNSVSSAYGDGDKFKEELNTVAGSRDSYIFFDDMAGSLFNQDLNRWVTDSTWGFRVFHTQRKMKLDKNCMTIVTDNGCTLSDDLIRRSVIVSFAAEERAVDRQDKLKLEITERWLMSKANRGRVLSIWWSMISHWAREGMADAPKRIPSFSDWTNVVGGVVGAAGYGDAFEAAGLAEGGDKRRTDVDTLLAEVIAKYEVTDRVELDLKQLCAVARENDIFTYELGDLQLVKLEMDNAPGKFYDMPTEGIMPDAMKYEQALCYMHPQKQASPFSKRLKKQLDMKFTINGGVWKLTLIKGRHNKYVIECVEPF